MPSSMVFYDEKLKEAIKVYGSSNGCPNIPDAIIDSLKTFYGLKEEPKPDIGSALPAMESHGKAQDIAISTKSPILRTIASKADIDAILPLTIAQLRALYAIQLKKELDARKSFSVSIESSGRLTIIRD